AHARSNSSTTPALDHTPLRSTSITRLSSVSGFHTGHVGHEVVLTGFPPSTARVSSFDKTSANNGCADAANPSPKAPKVPFLMKSRREWALSNLSIIIILF